MIYACQSFLFPHFTKPDLLELHKEILKQTGASRIVRTVLVQSLWSGYGEIKRFYLAGGKYPRIIVKHIQLPNDSQHPKGWNTAISHQRKLTSYQVEREWYQHFANQTNEQCKVPQIYQALEMGAEILLIMEDLDASGYIIRVHPESINLGHVKSCLEWLAHFHANFMGVDATRLWPIGTYWHLDTRPDEWAKMGNRTLKKAAKAIDQKLNQATFQTIVHGDAKLANFCFHEAGKIAAVDFQYVGKGCGMKDVAYFISSCFDDPECERHGQELLDYYFSSLEKALEKARHKSIDFQQLKQEWSGLYKYAWADFYRFLDGWSPGHWKMHGYSERLSQLVIDELNK